MFAFVFAMELSGLYNDSVIDSLEVSLVEQIKRQGRVAGLHRGSLVNGGSMINETWTMSHEPHVSKKKSENRQTH